MTCKTTRLKYGHVHWVRIDRMQRVNEFATVDPGINGNTDHRETDNVLRIHPVARCLTAHADPSRHHHLRWPALLHRPLAPGDAHATLHGSGAIINWTETDALPGGCTNARDWKGRSATLYTSKFLVVYGASGNPADTIANRGEANTFCQYWNEWMGGSISARADTAVTPVDIAQNNLILYGTAQSNALLRQMQPNLPIQVNDTGINVGTTQFNGTQYGCYFIYPNPLNPAHYIVVSHQSIPGAVPKDLEALSWYWPDYVVFDTTRQPGACIQSEFAYLPETFVDTGYFDANWQLNVGPAQPDLLIRTEAQREFLGEHIYNNLDTQTVEQTVAPQATAVYYAEVRNNGGLDDMLLLSATPSLRGMMVKYIDVPTGQDVTARLTTSPGWRIPLDRHAARQLRIEVTLDATVPAGAARDALLSVSSVNDTTQTDQVRATTHKTAAR